jgi:hypothetical protein
MTMHSSLRARASSSADAPYARPQRGGSTKRDHRTRCQRELPRQARRRCSRRARRCRAAAHRAVVALPPRRDHALDRRPARDAVPRRRRTDARWRRAALGCAGSVRAGYREGCGRRQGAPVTGRRRCLLVRRSRVAETGPWRAPYGTECALSRAEGHHAADRSAAADRCRLTACSLLPAPAPRTGHAEWQGSPAGANTGHLAHCLLDLSIWSGSARRPRRPRR